MNVVYLGSLLAVVNPAAGGKVGGLSTVEPVVEAGVVTIGEGDHELPRHLSDLGEQREVKKGGDKK